MKSAMELLEITNKRLPERVNEILAGAVEHIEERCEEEAEKGNYYYSIYLRKIESFCRELLLKECVKIAKHFEDDFECGVSIDDNGNGYWLEYTITVSWDGKIRKSGRRFGACEHLYDSEIGLAKRKEEKID